jgi:hypothetical protein
LRTRIENQISGGRGEQIVQERYEIRFSASIADGAADFARGEIERGDEGFRAVPGVLELAPFDVPWLHRQARIGTFQRLDARHLVTRNGLHALFGGARGRLIHRADIGALGVERGIRLGGQPAAAAMWLEMASF